MPKITNGTVIPKGAISVAAPAKINLTLHVTGQREDGYHTLDSLVVFSDVGDTLTMEFRESSALVCGGPEAESVPENQDNLVLRVARLFRDGPGLSIHLNKQLPVSSGIGGGSADAAAAFRGFVFSQGKSLDEYTPSYDLDGAENGNLTEQLLALGADIPVCIQSQSTRMRGIGSDLTPVEGLPILWAVLINPRVPVSTPAVFKALDCKSNAPMPLNIPRFADVHQCVSWLKKQRNDLEGPACLVAPEITQVLEELKADATCLFARMSGSGATCFGIYADKEAAGQAAATMARAHPAWWVRETMLGSMKASAKPRVR